MIFNIQRYSTHDGPGIRTVVFIKGCPLACRWCQNPESRSCARELLYDARLCVEGCDLCQRCVPGIIERVDKAVAIHREHLTEQHYQRLVECCPTQALTVCGEAMDAERVMNIVLRDASFYLRSGGGMTLSGGEPFMSPLFSQQLLARCHQSGIHTAVETCLHVPWSYIEPSLASIDLFLADLKHTDSLIFKEWTHGSAKRVMENLKKLVKAGKHVIIRVPLIPGFNADELSIQAITDFAADELGLREIHFLPYHTLGMNKYVLLNQPYLAANKPLQDPSLLEFAENYGKGKGMTVMLRG